ncbi:pilus assembly protein, partial [Actinomadura sp. DSM 109109]|nr:pilus assembly protein [Actinomadura lepetitiana]
MTRRLFRDERGIALVEFALSVPLLLLMFIGSYQLTDAISAYRKVTTATRAIADLSSQYTTVSNSDLDN